jgi:uncharacterized protein YciI
VVQLLVVEDGAPYVWGSGTIISPDGLVLTNAHVVAPDGPAAERIEVALTDAADRPPETTYVAEIVSADVALDLAIVRISETLGGDAVDEPLPYVEVGDSDALEIGDELRILGYPGIGGETITLTSGRVSGFVDEAGLGHRAWVKTDATIAGGNSGGLAADDDGRIVAVPTVAGAGTEGEIADCRPIRDTNHDGVGGNRDPGARTRLAAAQDELLGGVLVLDREHLDLAWEAAAAGDLLLGGALQEPSDQAYLLFEGDTPEAAEGFARRDPYVKNGLVKEWRVRPWMTVVGKEAASPVK